MANIEGASADPVTRRALVRGAVVAVVAFVVPLVALVLGLSMLLGAESHQDALEQDGRQQAGLVLTVDHPVPGIDRATFAYDGGAGRVTKTMIVFNDYERGQRVVAFVDPADPSDATLAGETPQTGWHWVVAVTALLVGVVGVPFGVVRLLRWSRVWSVAREHPWTPWSMQAIYPKRRRLAVTTDGSPDEHLLRVDRPSARRLGRIERKSTVRLAGSGRWFIVSSPDDPGLLALGRMDVPYRRLSLVGPGATHDRFDVEEPPDEVF